MPGSSSTTLSRRDLLGTALLAGIAPAALAASEPPVRGATAGRTTDTVRLTWGFGGLPLIAKERGAFAELLAFCSTVKTVVPCALIAEISSSTRST